MRSPRRHGLAETARDLLRAPDLASSARRAVVAARDLTDSRQVALRLLDADRKTVRVTTRCGPSVNPGAGPRPVARQGLLGGVLRRCRPLLCNRGAADPRFVRTRHQVWSPTAILAAPLRGPGGAVGVLSAARGDARPYGREDLQVLELLADLLAARLDAARLERDSLTDTLTGLPNRRHLGRSLRRLAARAREQDQSLSVILADIDRFKAVNDEFGHDVGDEVLAAVAGRLRRACRRGEFAGRWGGEEFLVVVPGPAHAGPRVAERLRRALDERPVDTSIGRLAVTLSLGVAVRRPGERFARLARRADRALYRAKETGRNRAVLAGAPRSAQAGD